MKRVILAALVVGLAVGIVEGKRIPRNANAKPKTLADQQAQNAKTEEQLQKRDGAQPPAPVAAPVAQPTTTPSSVVLARAQATLSNVEKRLWAGFEKSEEYVKAAGALKDAQGGYDAAFRAMTVKLGDRPEYAAAVGEEKKAEEELAAARAGTGGDTAGAAARVLEAKKAVHQMEAGEAEKDEGVKAAKGNVAEARGAVEKLRKGFEETMKGDADYVAAKQKVEEARKV